MKDLLNLSNLSSETLMPFAVMGVIGLLIFLILVRWPYLGVAAMAASLPVSDILPDIPFATSGLAVIGATTLVAFVLHRVGAQGNVPPFAMEPVHILGLLFLLWLVASNPFVTEAGAGSIGQNRNFLYTFGSLWIVCWMVGEIVTTKERQQILMWIFCIACIVSAAYAIKTGNIGTSVKTSVRAEGLAGHFNTAARMMLGGFICQSYLALDTKRMALRIFGLLGMSVLLLGIAYTTSRTGFLLIIVTLAMLFFGPMLRQRRALQVALVVGAVGLGALLPATYWEIAGGIFTSASSGQDTAGDRYQLWMAGFQMVRDHPVNGVGPGQFPNELAHYGIGLLDENHRGLSAHNLYVVLIAEHGIVGFLVFMTMLTCGIWSLMRHLRDPVPDVRYLAYTWLTVLVMILVGGLTKHDHYSKLLWMALGMGSAIGKIARQQGKRELETVPFLSSDVPALAASPEPIH